MVSVVGRKFDEGWEEFVRHAHISSGNILLAAYSGGTTISFLRFRKKIGVRSAWQFNADAYGVDSELIDEDELPNDLDIVNQTVPYMTSYFPPYMSLLFSEPSGVCVFDSSCRTSMVSSSCVYFLFVILAYVCLLIILYFFAVLCRNCQVTLLKSSGP